MKSNKSKFKLRDPKDITSVEALTEEVKKVLLLEDEGVVKIITAATIANRMDGRPVWLMLVAPASGSKSFLINCLNDLEFVHPVSDLTTNTFASGFKRNDKESSLLLKIQNGILTFKDFTSVLSRRRETRAELLGQLREIYDGEYVKHFGTGEDVTWRGKMGAIAGVTEVVYRYLADLSAMGDRFAMYCIDQPDKINASRKAIENGSSIKDLEIHLRECFKNFIGSTIDNMEEDEIHLSEDIREELLIMAAFAVDARSAVMTDFKTGMVDFVPSKEMPMRLIEQLYALATAIIVINKANEELPKDHPAHQNDLTQDEKKLIIKCAFDSIPVMRRKVLSILAQYRLGVRTAGMAISINLSTEMAKKYLFELNALQLCERIKRGQHKQGDLWKMDEKTRMIIAQALGIEVYDSELIDNKLDEDEENITGYNESLDSELEEFYQEQLTL